MVCEKLHNTGVSDVFFKILIFLSLFLSPYFSHSTHIVGGALTYVYNGGSSYTITLKLYRDCGGGSAAFPDPVTISVRGYNGEIFSPSRDFSMPLGTVTPVPSNLDTCADPPNPMPCVEEGIYTITVTNLPPNPGGYHLYYQVCCRNGSVINCVSPLTTGGSFYAYIPGTSVIWLEDFTLTNGITSDAGATAWSRTPGTPAPAYAEVNNNLFEFSGNNDASATWTSQVIDISSYSAGVNVSVDLSENSGLEANDSIIVYYSLNGGPLTQFTTNGFIAGNFGSVIATVNALIGSNIQIFVYVHYDGASSGEIYRCDNVQVVANNFQANNNPQYTLFPPLFLCVGQPFSFDHSATDVNGDSLVYSFYTPYDDIAPTFTNNQTNFTPITWVGGFSATNPLGGTPLVLNSATGLLTGTPTTLGQYVVGVMVKEYRNGICIDSTLRDFQFNVVNCPPPATAVLPDTTYACSGLSVSFSNLGNPSANNWWSFGDPAVTNDTSVLANPSYNYPLEGYYNVVLITNKGTFCADTDTTVVLVAWVDAGFVADTVGCAGDLFDFNDTSSASSNLTITGYQWNFGDGNTSTSQDTTHIYITDGSYTVTHIVTTNMGCTDTVIKTVIVNPAPVFVIDMTGNPDSVWTSPSVVRDCRVCASEPPDVCITFILTLDPATQAISFDLTAGAVPPGALYYQISCGDSIKVGDTICIDGVGPHQITFCKPGNNPNEYTISAITEPEVSPPITVSDGCMDTISAIGYIESSVTWTSVSPGAQGTYDTYLNCPVGCDTVIVTSQPGYPPSVDYMVCGLPAGGGSCSMTPVCDTTTVYFVSTLAVGIVPQNPTICFGGTNATVTANPSGGASPYSYLWNTGSTTASITVAAGTYYVTISDTTNCQPVIDSVTVTAFASDITANAGIDQTICAGTPSVTLSGTVTGVTTGTWSGGAGTYSLSKDSLNTTYSPTAAEITSGSLQLFLTTTGNGTCPADTDTILITFNVLPTTANAGPDQVICGVTSATLSANNPTVGTGVWSFVSGSATITNPNSPSTTVTGLVAGNSYVLTWTISNGVCPPSTDNVTINVDLLPTTANAGADQTLCNTTIATLAGNTPTVGSGLWSVIVGTVTITSPTSPASTVTGLVIGGSCTLRWTITQGVCNSIDDVTITVNQLPTIADAGTDQTFCNITTSTLSGNSAFVGTGLWSVIAGTATITTPTSPTSTVTGLIVGTSVTLRWTISNGVCPPSTDDVTITINALPTTANAGTDQTICETSAIISANSPTVGTGVWSVISGTATITNPNLAATSVTGLAFGSSYTFRWTISNGTCPASTDDVIINVDLMPTAATAGIDQIVCGVTFTNLSANTPTSGTGAWSIISGTATITNSNSPSTSVTGLIAGSTNIFQWIITNGVCPASVDSVTVNVDLTPTPPNAGTDQVLCNVAIASLSGNNPTVGNGSWAVISGTANLTSPSSPASAVTGLVPGDTSVFQWTISQGVCTGSDTVFIFNDDFDSVTISKTNISCFGGNNGTATATPANGNPPYSFQWSNSQTDSTATGLSASTYDITVTDENGCFVFSAITISQPPLLSVTIDSSVNVSCKGGNNGFAIDAITGGTSPYSYLWSDGSLGPSAQNLVNGTYIISATDANGCVATDSITITEPATSLSASTSSTSALCKGDSNGTATVIPSGATSPYTYQWDINANSQTDSTATGLFAGIYIVTITDNNNCTFDTSVTVTEPATLLALDTSSTFVICNGDNNGTATVTPSGGISPYTYLWDTNANSQTDSTATALAAGTYSVTVTDNNGCKKITVIFVDQPFSPLSISLSVDSVKCFAGNDGIAIVTPSGGTSPYTYQWDDGNSQTDSMATGLIADTFNVTVTDNTGNCKVGNEMIINQPDSLVLNPSSSNVSCFGGSDGNASVNPFGGTAPYSFSWNTNQTISQISNLTSQIYSVTVTDNNNCSDSANFFITEPAAPLSISSLVFSNVKCNGGNDGNASVSVSGGTIPYAFLWDDINQTITSNVNGLISGLYNVMINDYNGCTIDTSVTITEPSPGLTVSISATNVNCFGGNDGTATITPAGGTSPYFYQWDINANSQTDSTATGLITGTYSVTVTDNNGCILDTNSAVFVGQPATYISVVTSQTDVSCYGDSDGTSGLSVSGGTPPYSYLWGANANSQVDSTATGLMAGFYNATVTDNNGCADDTINVIISEPAPLLFSLSATDVICKGNNNGTATITPSGGIPPYSYLWDSAANSQIDSTATGLIAGIYSATITDANGCVNDSASITITEPSDSLSFATTFTDVLCYGDSNGTATVTPSGGISPYTYQWDLNAGMQTDSTSTGLKPGSYSVIVSDSSGCIDSSASVTVSEPQTVIASATENDTICPGESSTINATGNGGVSPYIYEWNIGSGQSQTVSPSSNTIYTVIITDFNNCASIADSVTVFVRNYYFDSLIFSCAPALNCTICMGDSIIISATYYEEFPPYNYLWNQNLGNGLGPKNVSLQSTTDYILKVSDQCGSFQDTLTVFVDTFPVVDVLAVSPGCEPHTVTFENSVQNPPGSIYTWNSGDGIVKSDTNSVFTHTYNNDDTYIVSLIVNTPNDCSEAADTAATVIVYPEPEPNCTANPATATLQNPVINFSTGNFTSWLWDFNDGDTDTSQNPIHTYKDSGDYNITVLVTNQYDCENTCEVTVRINPLYPLGIPNAFTPDPNGSNGGVFSFDDFTNNVFFPITRYVTDYHLEIFNRWGELLFESFDINRGWDGYYRGELCQMDVYVWKIHIQWWDKQEFNEVGDVTLLR